MVYSFAADRPDPRPGGSLRAPGAARQVVQIAADRAKDRGERIMEAKAGVGRGEFLPVASEREARAARH
jgi:hypothetical protein